MSCMKSCYKDKRVLSRVPSQHHLRFHDGSKGFMTAPNVGLRAKQTEAITFSHERHFINETITPQKTFFRQNLATFVYNP